MFETQFDLDGDGYAETLAYHDGDGYVDYLAMDTDLDGVAETHTLDLDENGIFETGLQDLENDGVFETVSSVPNGDALVIDSGAYDVSGASGAVAAAEGMMAPYFANGGMAVPTATPEPRRFDSYSDDTDGDGWVDAMDQAPTTYGLS